MSAQKMLEEQVSTQLMQLDSVEYQLQHSLVDQVITTPFAYANNRLEGLPNP